MNGSIISLFDRQDMKAFRKFRVKRKRKKKEEMENLKKEVAIDDHIIPLNEFLERYQTDPEKGLTNEEAKARLAKYGLNMLTPPRTTSQFVVLLNHLFSGFAIILWVSGILCLVAYGVQSGTQDDPDKNNVYLASIIFIVVIITALFGFAQDRTSSKIMESFKKMITPVAVVIRDGKATTVPSDLLVKGDVVLVKFGDKVPADIRIIENFGMKVDNSSLTGETDPQPRGTENTSENLMETQNVAFYSSNVMEGTCKGIVFETGDRTVIGRLATLTIGLSRDESPMTKEIRYFIKLITIVSILFSVVFTAIALALQYSVTDCIIYFIAFMVANIPEGLLVTVTLSLTLAAKKMAKRNCLIKSLDSVETLGSTSTICSDKTGTLTQNRMTVHEIMYSFKLHPINYTADRNSTENDAFNRNDPDFINLMRCARLCLRADFDDYNEPAPVLDKVVDGDASEAAILKCVECIFGKVHEYRRNNHKLFEVPFNSNNKYQLSIHRCDNVNVLCMKGAPETIISMCSTVSMNGRDIPMTADNRDRIERFLHLLASKGERVLGYCDRELPDDSATKNYDPQEKNFPLRDLRFLGLMALIDPPREAVPEAVAKCKTAGIRVIMVTGDHPITAEAIARKVGIISGDTRNDAAKKLGMNPKDVPQSAVNAIVVPGDKLRELTNDELDQVLVDHEEIVFARTTPTQKLQIVEGCQRLGYITAVTGDGVNDSPALKKADIGVAMGIAGSEVSKQAADMILLDDNFASIVVGVEQGRIIFDNLKKSIAYVLTSNIPEMAPFIAYIVFSVPLPLSVIAILIVDVGTDMLPAIALAYERAESDIMKRKPRNPFVDKMVNRRLIWMAYGQIGIMQTVGAFTAYFLVMAQHGFFPEDILGVRQNWDNPSEVVTDSYGQQWSFDQRKFLEHYCQSCFLAAIIVTQIADALICKTRRNSIIQQGMGNWPLNVGLIFALSLGCFMLYVPGLYQFLLLPPIRAIHWLPGVPFALMIIFYDEARRCIIRHRPGGWVEREFYY